MSCHTQTHQSLLCSNGYLATHSRLKALSATHQLDAAPSTPRSSSVFATANGASPAPASEQRFLKLPIESARKLRFYDRPDLSELIKQHAADKAVLEAANEALLQVIAPSGPAALSIPPRCTLRAPARLGCTCVSHSCSALWFLLVTSQQGLHGGVIF